MDGRVITATWARSEPVENRRRRPNEGLPDGVVHLRQPIVRNPAPGAYAEAIHILASALSPAAFERATEKALRKSRDETATEQERADAQAAFAMFVGDWGWSRAD
jgi:hypothetical protein